MALHARVRREERNDELHPEDAFIAEFSARVARICATNVERNAARALAAEVLDVNPELAYPWGQLSLAAQLRIPLLSARLPAIARATSAALERVLVRWLLETGRLERSPARMLSRNVRSARSAKPALAA